MRLINIFRTANNPPPEVKVLPHAQPNHDYIQPLQRPMSESKVDEGLPSYAGVSKQSPSSAGTLGNKSMAQRLVNSSQVINQSSQNYQQLMSPITSVNSASSSTEQSTLKPGQWLQVTDTKMLVKVQQRFYLLETKALHLSVMSKIYVATMPVSQPLLMPISITATTKLLAQAKALYQPLLENSVEIGWTPNRIILRKVPAGLRQFRWIECLEDILTCTETDIEKVRKHLLNSIVSYEEITPTQIQELWQQFVHSSINLEHDISQIGKPVDLDNWLNAHA